jgi:hypothetical protein
MILTDCETCGGGGMVQTDAGTYFGPPDERPCRDCGETGQVPATRCDVCLGPGPIVALKAGLLHCEACELAIAPYEPETGTRCLSCACAIGDVASPTCAMGMPDGSVKLYCLSCAPKAAGLTEAFPQIEESRQHARWCFALARAERRLRPVTLGEVRAGGEQ